MFDIGAVELLIVAVVAIIVVGPKDLPRMLRVAGQWVGKMKAMTREFQAQFEAAADEVGLDEIRKDIQKVTDFDADPDFMNPLEQVKDIGNSIRETIESPVKSAVKHAAGSDKGSAKSGKSGSKKQKQKQKQKAKPASSKSAGKSRAGERKTTPSAAASSSK